MQQQQRRLFGLTRLAIEDLDIANGNRPIPGDRLSGHRRRKAAEQSDCCKGCGEKRAIHRKIRGWRLANGCSVSEPKINYFPSRQSLNIWIYYLAIRENEIEPDQRSAGLCRRGRKGQPDKRRASAWPIVAIRQPLTGGD